MRSQNVTLPDSSLVLSVMRALCIFKKGVLGQLNLLSIELTLSICKFYFTFKNVIYRSIDINELRL